MTIPTVNACGVPSAGVLKNPQFRGFFGAGGVNHVAFPAEIEALQASGGQFHQPPGELPESRYPLCRLIALAHDFRHRRDLP